MKSSEILVAVVFAIALAIGVYYGVYYVVSRDIVITPQQRQIQLQEEILEELRNRDN
jgi:hypothetical protein